MISRGISPTISESTAVCLPKKAGSKQLVARIKRLSFNFGSPSRLPLSIVSPYLANIMSSKAVLAIAYLSLFTTTTLAEIVARTPQTSNTPTVTTCTYTCPTLPVGSALYGNPPVPGDYTGFFQCAYGYDGFTYYCNYYYDTVRGASSSPIVGC